MFPKNSNYYFYPGASSYYNVVLDSHEFFYYLGGSFTASNDVTYKTTGAGFGTLTMGNYNITANNYLWQSGYVMAGTGVISVTGNWTKSGGACLAGAFNIAFTGSGNSVFTPGSGSHGSVTVNKSTQNAVVSLATNNLTMAGSKALTITSGIFDIAGLNLDIGAGSTFSNDGTLRLQGGETLTNLTNDTNSGTVAYNGTGSYASLKAGNSYYNLTFNGSGSWTHTALLTVNRALAITSGTLSSAGQNIALTGNWSNSGTYTSGSNTVTFNGTNQTITGNSTFNNLTKSVATADTLTFAAGSTTTINGIATINGASGQLLSLVSSSSPTKWNFILGAAATKTGITYVSVKDSDASSSAAGLKPIEPNNSTDAGNTVSWFAVVYSVAGTVYTDEGSTIAVGKTIRLLVNGVSVGTAITDASGNYSIPATTAAGDALLVFISGDATYKGTTVTVSSGGNHSGINVYAGYVITRHDNGGSLSNANLNTAKGAYAGGDAGDIHYSVSAGNLTVSGSDTLYIPSGAYGSFTPAANVTTPAMKSLGTFNGGSFSDTINGALTVAGGTFTATSGTTSVSGNFAITANCTINTGTISVAGNVSSTAATVNGTASITLNGSGAQTITATGADLPNGTLTIDKTSGTATLAANLALVGGGLVVVNQGTLDLAGFNLTGVTAVASAFSVKNGATLKLWGSETVATNASRTYNAGSTVLYYGSGSYGLTAATSVSTYNGNLAFEGTGRWGHRALYITVYGDLTINAVSTLDSTMGAGGGKGIIVFGNWTNRGNFVANTYAVSFEGTNQTISGNTTFGWLAKTVTMAATLTFEAGSTTTVNDRVTLKGAAGQLLSLVSSSSPTKWNFILGASAIKVLDVDTGIEYVSVKDSDASGSDAGQKPINPTNSVDSLNTVSWFGIPSLLVVKSASSGTAAPGTDVIFTIQVSNSGNAAAIEVVLDSILSPFMSLSLDAYGAGQPFQFVDGAPPSLLALGTPSYSNNNGGTWVYVPASGGAGAPAGYDGAVTNWKMPMTGSMGAGTSFTLRYKERVK